MSDMREGAGPTTAPPLPLPSLQTAAGQSAAPAPASPMFVDSAQPVPEGKRIPIEDVSNVAGTVPQWIYDSLLRSYEAERAMRKDSSALFSIASLLGEILTVQRHILAALGSSSDSRSSVELKVSSARTSPDPTVKVYEGSPVDGLVDTALAEFGRLKREAEARAMNLWAATVSDLAEQKS